MSGRASNSPATPTRPTGVWLDLSSTRAILIGRSSSSSTQLAYGAKAATARPYASAPRQRSTREPGPGEGQHELRGADRVTMRMGMRRFTRLTNAFSKKVENLKLSPSSPHYTVLQLRPLPPSSPHRDDPGDGGRGWRIIAGAFRRSRDSDIKEAVRVHARTAKSINSEAQEAQRTVILSGLRMVSDPLVMLAMTVRANRFLYTQAARAETSSINMAFSDSTKALRIKFAQTASASVDRWSHTHTGRCTTRNARARTRKTTTRQPWRAEEAMAFLTAKLLRRTCHARQTRSQLSTAAKLAVRPAPSDRPVETPAGLFRVPSRLNV